MPEFVVLQRSWKEYLARLLGSDDADALISSPYIIPGLEIDWLINQTVG